MGVRRGAPSIFDVGYSAIAILLMIGQKNVLYTMGNISNNIQSVSKKVRRTLGGSSI